MLFGSMIGGMTQVASSSGGVVAGLYHFENNLNDDSGNNKTAVQNLYIAQYTSTSPLSGTYSYYRTGTTTTSQCLIPISILTKNKFTIDFVASFTQALSEISYFNFINSVIIGLDPLGAYNGNNPFIAVGAQYAIMRGAWEGDTSNNSECSLTSLLNQTIFFRIIYDLTKIRVFRNGVEIPFDMPITSTMMPLTPAPTARISVDVIANASGQTTKFDELRITLGEALSGAIIPSLPLTTTP